MPSEQLSSKDNTHIIEGTTKSHLPSEKVHVEKTVYSINKKGGNSSGSENLFIDPKELTGANGLKRVMEYIDSKTPAIKGLFEYKPRIAVPAGLALFVKTLLSYVFE